MTTLLQGRLGNQLFEYAFARARCYENGQKCILSEAPLICKNIQNRLDCFTLAPDVEFVEKHKLSFLQRIGISFHSRFVGCKSRMEQYSLEKKYRNLFGILNLFMCEDGYIEPLSTKRDVLNIGYFQSEKYFKEYEEQILKELTFKDSIKESCTEWANKIKNSTEPTCLHIRLGDYVKNKLHGVADVSYYKRGISELLKAKPNATIFVFSDNIELVRKELNIEGSVYYIPSTIDEQQTMYLGSLCDNFIISNSSFSWWMQYLSRKQDRLVFAPSRWYAKPCQCDIYQDHWHLIKV